MYVSSTATKTTPQMGVFQRPVETWGTEMALEWTPNLSVGNDEIDNQHKELFKRVNGLTDAMMQRKGKEEIGRVIEFLERYVVEHFSTEENYMIRMKFPNFLTHKGQHAAFIEAFNEMKKRYEESGPTLEVIITAQTKLGDWLRRHIPVSDRELGTFLRAKEHAKSKVVPFKG